MNPPVTSGAIWIQSGDIGERREPVALSLLRRFHHPVRNLPLRDWPRPLRLGLAEAFIRSSALLIYE